MCGTMQEIIDRERYDADIKARMDVALNLWSEGEKMQVLNLEEKNTERMEAINKFTLMDDTFMTQVFQAI